MKKRFSCPLTAETVAHPCPVRACPSNFADVAPQDSCLQVKEDVSYATLAELLQVEVAEVKRRALLETTALGEVMLDLRKTLEFDGSGACSRCGYCEPCRNLALCGERHEAVARIQVKYEANSARGLRAPQLWWAVVHGHTRFLQRHEAATLQELVTQRRKPHAK